jgi:hypothetical protein
MGVVMIKCPITGLNVSTGIELEPKTFIELPAISTRMSCGSCGGDHVWSKREAWLVEEGAPAAEPGAT